MKNEQQTKCKEQVNDLRWAALVLMGAMESIDGNVDVAINMVEMIAERGEHQAQELAKTMLRSSKNKTNKCLNNAKQSAAKAHASEHEMLAHLKELF